MEKEVSFKIDRTAPVGRFRALDVDDPALLVADVRDATSGVADGWIEYRPVSGGAFKRLPSNIRDGVLAARMPDGHIADGQYAVRAVVSDVAGNRAIVDTRAGGGAMTLTLPLRASATLDVGARVPARKGCPAKRRGKRQRHKRNCGRTAPVRQLTVDHDRRVIVEGSLTAGGSPLAGMTLLVDAQTAGHDDFIPLGTTVTDSRGRFRRTIPPGPSRTIRVRFVGTNRLGTAAGAIATKVPAAVALNVDRRRLLNGQAVRFRGRLLGKPVPASGKLVALQAKVPGGWRTFATPRANARGRFKHRYRFTSTTGLRRYRFRALVDPEPAYPYARGLSKVVTVTVRGR
ncbi:MAG: carboxypeptidase-like regulatory domain-containing protein [Solirubrobacterales bacterium]|nr:carboxypeptidase-like regulatory domain-containing protein [Solirubrobacterales bacterium]